MHKWPTVHIQGVKQVKLTDLNARFMFLSPPSLEELEKRLRGRGTETEESLSKRLTQAKNEMEFSTQPGAHDKIVVNDDLEKAYVELRDWVVDGGKFGAQQWFPLLLSSVVHTYTYTGSGMEWLDHMQDNPTPRVIVCLIIRIIIEQFLAASVECVDWSQLTPWK